MIDVQSITLDGVLPRVFADADAPWQGDSHVWRTRLTFERGLVYLVEAESGTGKSSLCSYIYGNRHDYEGRILFGIGGQDAGCSLTDRDIRTLSTDDWCQVRRRSIALLPQELRLFPELTAWENVQIKNRLTHHLSDDEVGRMFDRLEISEKRHRLVSQLSIGQQQRVAIIRALAQPFNFILLDEPVSHLDARNNRIVADLILECARAQRAGIITTSVGNPLLIDGEYQQLSL